MAFEKIRTDAKKFIQELDEEIYLSYAGLKDECNTSAIYQKYGHLASKEVIEKLKPTSDDPDPEEKRRVEALKSLLVGLYMGQQTKELEDELATKEAQATIKIDGKDVSYRYSSVIIANEMNRDARRLIHQEQKGVIVEHNPLRKEKFERHHQISRSLGYENYVDLCIKLKKLNLYKLAEQMNKFLDRTKSRFESYFSKVAEKYLKLPLEQVEAFDIPYLFRASKFDPFFKSDQMLKIFKATLKGLGIDFDSQKQIILDIEKREKKSPRAFCSPIEIPNRVMLVIMPREGHDDYQALFHEAGHALHFGFVDPNLPFEYAYLGDNSVTETFAFLFDHLVTDPTWIDEYLALSQADKEEYLTFVNTIELRYLRRYGAKLLYELKLHAQDEVAGKEKDYSELLTQATLVKMPEELYLYDVDDGFYCAQYLQAWIFEAQLESHLKEKFGTKWFKNPKAGDFLKELWAMGQKYDAWELSNQLGFGGLKISVIENRLENALPFPLRAEGVSTGGIK